MTEKISSPKSVPSVRRSLTRFHAIPILLALGVFGYLTWTRPPHSPPGPQFSSTPFATVPIKGLTADLYTESDQLHTGTGDNVLIQFRNGGKELVEVGEVTFELNLNMPGMVMHSMGKVLRTKKAGEYRTTVGPPVPGDWKAELGFSGPAGNAQTNFNLTVK